MKLRITYSLIFLLCSLLPAFSQHNEDHDHNHEHEKEEEMEVPRRPITTWKIDETLGTMRAVALDTASVNFQNTTTDHPYSIANAYNGNMGSPLESKIYFDRSEKTDFLFMKPYMAYYKSVSDFNFYNTKTPYSNLTYYRAGPSYGREERLKTDFSVNVNPNFNVGFLADYTYGRGIYQYQSTNHIIGGLFGSYTGKRYEAHAIAALNNFKNYENGGIADDRYITNPRQMGENDTYDPQNTPVNLPAKSTSNVKNRLFFYNHKYHLGFERTDATDSTITNFIPVTTFTHTIKYELDSKGYWDRDTITYYENAYFDKAFTNDSARYSSLKNTVAISLNEEFNTFARFGLTAFVSHNFEQFRFIQDSTLALHTTDENSISLGGVLSKYQGVRLRYDATGEVAAVGYRAGEFNVTGNLYTSFPLWKKDVELSAKGFIENKKPNYFLNNYVSNHFIWQEDFDSEYKTHVSGRLAIPKLRFEFNAGIENINNYIYFNHTGSPAQHNSNIQVMALNLKQDFALWHFRLENQVIYQVSSSQDVLPLPDLSLYHNLYFIKTLFKVLTVQLGADVHYNTAYYAPYYMPATGQFQVQNTTKVGNYPVFNVYANVQLKRMHFFLLYYHANYKISEDNYFSMPNYPINPSMLKIGISWNFYD